MNLSKLSEDANPVTESENPLWWNWIPPLQTSTTILWSKPKHKHKLNPHFSCKERKKTQTQKLEYIDQNSPSILLWFWFWFFKMCYGQHQACSRDSLTSSTNPMRDQLIIERAQNPQHQRSFVLRFCKQNLNPNPKTLENLDLKREW